MTTPFDPSVSDGSPVETVLVSPTRDLGDGFHVRRALPSATRQMVGPFIFFDQFGPAVFSSGQGLDVRPHPHIGLATLTYLFAGEILHRDSLGIVQSIKPGEVNWMTAGRGIVHSERTPPERRDGSERLYGIQCWLALPKVHEEVAPGFVHHAAAEIPVVQARGLRARIVAGALFGAQSPLQTFSHTIYADAELDADVPVALDGNVAEERAIYVVEGAVEVSAGTSASGQTIGVGQMAVFRPGTQVVMKAPASARLLVVGGERADGPRHIWWNLVSSSADRIQQAKEDWKTGRLGHVPTETEFIPLPEEPPPPVRYP